MLFNPRVCGPEGRHSTPKANTNRAPQTYTFDMADAHFNWRTAKRKLGNRQRKEIESDCQTGPLMSSLPRL
jgi:hypothetical protein